VPTVILKISNKKKGKGRKRVLFLQIPCRNLVNNMIQPKLGCHIL